MIADSTFCSNSSLLSEGVSYRDSDVYRCPTGETWGLDMDIMALEQEIQRMRDQSIDVAEMNRHLDSLSCDTSIASSECSEELSIDVEGEELGIGMHRNIEGNLFYEDLSSSIMNIFDETNIAESIVLDAVDWNNSTDLSSDIPSILEVNAKIVSRKNPSVDELVNKKWTQLKQDEQVLVVEHLSQVISTKLGLREQLEVIRLINPTARISPTDTEFVINLETINEEKFQKIQAFVKLQCRSNCETELNTKTSPSKKQAKKLRSQERRNQLKQHTQRQKKEHRQMLKEKRSGLFVKEEVMSLSCHEINEETIDVLE